MPYYDFETGRSTDPSFDKDSHQYHILDAITGAEVYAVIRCSDGIDGFVERFDIDKIAITEKEGEVVLLPVVKIPVRRIFEQRPIQVRRR